MGQTTCRKRPLTLFGKKDCEYVEGSEECYDKTVAVVNDVPEESCDLVPNQTCKGVYRLMPYLEPTQQCKEVPKEICSFGFKPAVPGEKPLITKWCYDQSQGDLSKESLSNKLEGPPELSPLNTVGSLLASNSLNMVPETQSENYSDYDTSEEDSSFTKYSPIDRKGEFYFGENSNPSEVLIGKSSSLTLMPPAVKYEEFEGRKGKQIDIKSKKRINPRNDVAVGNTDKNFIDILETVKQDPEGSIQFRKHLKSVKRKSSEKSPTEARFDVLIPDVFRFPSIKQSEQEKQPLNHENVLKGRNENGGKRKPPAVNIKKDEAQLIPNEFNSIVSTIENKTKKQIKIEKAIKNKSNKRNNAIASVIKHSDSPIAQTVVIQNTPEAHKAFGVRNAPRK